MSTHLADPDSGLICAYLLDGHGGARKLAWSEIDEAKKAEGTLWVHLDFSQARAAKWLTEHSGVDSTVTEAMLEEDTRPRSFKFDNGILVLLRGVNSNPDSDVEDMVSIRVWLEKDLILSTRRRRLLSVTDVRERLESGIGPTGADDFLAALTERLVDRIGEVVNNLQDQLDDTEAEFQMTGPTPQRGRFSIIRRSSARIRRYLAPQRDALDSLSRMRGDILSERVCMEMHEHANQMTYFVEELDLARERAMVAQEEILNILAHNQNSKMFLLAIVSAVFLPLSFLTGLMGMNVAGLPGLENPAAFNILIALMVAVGAGIMAIFWKKNWF